MSDFNDTDLRALFAARRALDQASAPAFETTARGEVLGRRAAGKGHAVRRGFIVALAAAAVVLALTLASRRRREPAPRVDAADVSRWSAPTDVLLRMSRDALQVPTLRTSALNSPTGN